MNSSDNYFSPLGYQFARSEQGNANHAVSPDAEIDKRYGGHFQKFRLTAMCGMELMRPRTVRLNENTRLTCERCEKWADRNGWPKKAVRG